MILKCQECRTEVSVEYDPEFGTREEFREGCVVWCPACKEQNDRLFLEMMRGEE